MLLAYLTLQLLAAAGSDLPDLQLDYVGASACLQGTTAIQLQVACECNTLDQGAYRSTRQCISGVRWQ